MSEDFLSRWSRRKQAAAQAAAPASSPPDAEGAAAPEPAAASGAPESPGTSGVSQNAPDLSQDSAAPAFDPASLPAIESITAETDIRAFFAAGVPAELTRAALRRVWTSDPKIRDFVGLADYDWDFNTPGSMAGFGPLEGADALRAQFARRLGAATAGDSVAGERVAEPSQQDLGAQDDHSQDDGSQDDHSVPEDSDRGRPDQPQIVTADEPSRKIDAASAHDELIRPDHDHAAVQQQEKYEEAQSITHRRHGGALPQA
jgi:uncharacterized protein DUF3306